jgi:ADP-ribose pyrophosphatase
MEDLLLTAKRFRVVRKTRTTAKGETDTREIVRHPGAVVLLPLLDDGRVVLIRNYRMSVDQTLIELPAGTIDPGEDPLETARRELTEETGYRAGSIELLTSYYPSPGILDERMRVYVAKGLVPGRPEPDVGEEIELLPATWDDALAMIGDGRIEDAKTIAGLLYYDRFVRPQ